MSARGVPRPEAGLLDGYRPLTGVPDELIGADGRPRPVWRPLLSALSAMPAGDLAARRARADRYLRDAGVFWRQYDGAGAGKRDWPLSHMPVLIAEEEWTGIAEGLVERADLLERVAADLYGPNRLVADGHLPPGLVAGNPGWLRPLVGTRPRGGHFLHFVAFDIGRGPDGTWWVLGDRTQAPSGAGFALETRIATARAYSDHYAHAHVHRLAGFFRRFRDSLLALREGDESRVGILTVIDGQLMVRTVSGPRPVSVLWRRLDSDWADPLELDETSQIGTPGLVSAVRRGSVAMVNALGSGVLETRALMAFLPRISRVLTGRPLALPNIATWWCGGAAERAHVRENAARMVLGDAFATGGAFDLTPPDDPRTLAERLEAQGEGLVAQESVTLSTTPAFAGAEGRLEPRPMALRVFLARTGSGWQVMPGGYARIGGRANSAELAMQRGGAAADVWVVAPGPVPAETMPRHAPPGALRLQPGVLPARAADNLYWLGRYTERTETLLRALRAHHRREAEAGEEERALLALSADHLGARGAGPDAGLEAAIGPVLDSALAAASHVRDRFSMDGWHALDALAAELPGIAAGAAPGDGAVHATELLLRRLAGFSGLVHENMYRFTGWRFLSVGRTLEQALGMADLLAGFADPAAPDGALDFALEVADSTMSHRRRYAAAPERRTVVDLVALDPLNPRAILYQLDRMGEHLQTLPGAEGYRQLSPLRRAYLRCQSGLATAEPDTLDSAALAALSAEIAGLSDLLTATYLR